MNSLSVDMTPVGEKEFNTKTSADFFSIFKSTVIKHYFYIGKKKGQELKQ